jgi:hypothetical protein
MRTLESKIERDTCGDALRKLRVPNMKMVHTGGETGWPDRCFFIKGGRPLFIEFKRPGEDTEPRQEYIHEMLRGLGYDVQVHDNKDKALEAIRSAKVAAARLPEALHKVHARAPSRRGTSGPRSR